MSNAEAFFDTNVLLYLVSSDAEKADRVEELLTQPSVISVQVLNEFTNVASRKFAMPLTEVREALETIRRICRTEPITVEDHDQALDVMERYKFSLYDSVIVASALRNDCEILYTEDLQHGQVIERQLEILNPFNSK
jgi:predicted nucleic acid-binding protein